MRNLIILFAFVSLVTSQSFAQPCPVSVTASSVNVLCGDTVRLNAQGAGVTVFKNDFNGCNLGTGWSASSTATFTNPCGSSPDGTCYLWMGNTAAAPRNATTNGYDLSTGGTICFTMRYAVQGGAVPCEGIDLPDEGVYLEYSVAGGPWQQIAYYPPNGGNDTYRTNWNRYCEPIPIGARYANTRVRWIQRASSDLNSDHWGLEDVQIEVNPPGAGYTWVHTGITKSTGDTPDIVPTVTGTYTCNFTYGTCTSSASVAITVNKHTVTASVNPNTPICPGDTVQLSQTNSFIPAILNCGTSNTGCVGNTTAIPIGTGTVNNTNYQMLGIPGPSGPVTVSSCSCTGSDCTGNYDNSGRTQMIFLASEFPAYFYQGQLYQLHLNATVAGAWDNFTIKMGCTNKQSFASSAATEFVSGLTTVYNGKTTNLAAGWNILEFDNSFDWDGKSNVIIQICWFGNSLKTGNVFKTATGFNSVVHTSTCQNAGCEFYNGSVNVVDQNRPSVRFGICYRLKPNLSYLWTPATSLTNDTIENPKAFPTNTTNYTLQVWDKNTPLGCAVTSSITVNIENVGSVDAKYDSVCVDSTLKLKAILSSTDPAVVYAWTGPGGWIDNVQNPTRSPGVAGWYYVTASKGGCSGTDSVLVKINQPPNPGGGYVDSLCVTNSTPYNLFTKLSGSPEAGGTWTSVGSPSAGSALSGQNFTASMAGTVPGDYKFKYQLTTTNGCGPRDTIVTIKVKKDPFAGLDSTFSVCNSGSTLNLFNYLKKNSSGRSADAGGTWSDISSVSAGSAFNTSSGVLNINNLTAGTYKFQYIVSANTPCPGQFAVITVTVQDQPEAGNPATGSVCINGTVFNLPSLIGGSFDLGGTWRKNSPFNGSLNVTTGEYTPSGAISDTGTFSFTYLLNAVSPCKADSVVIALKVNGYPSFSNTTTQCAANLSGYTMSANISGGQRSSYTVVPSGTISGNNPASYTSSQIANGTPQTFKVSDANNCKTDSVTVVKNCSCTTDAGIMSGNSESVCCGSLSSATLHQGGFVSDGNDILRFYLHEGSGTTLVNVKASGTTTAFGCVAGIVTGQTYYISAVAGNDNGSGNIDLNDGCLSVSAGTPVVFHPLPTGTLSGATNICPGDTTPLTVSFAVGTAPFEVGINDGSSTTTTTGLNGPSDIVTVAPATTTNYQLRTIKDSYGCVTTYPTNSNVTVNVNQAATGIISLVTGCSDGGSLPGAFDINVTGKGTRFTARYSNNLNGSAVIVSNFSGSSITINPTAFDPNKAVTYTLDTIYDNSGSVCNGQVSGSATIYPIPTASISTSTSTVCDYNTNNITLDFTLTGVGPWDITFDDGVGGAAQTIAANSNSYSHTLTNSIPGNYSYRILSVVDKAPGGPNCAGSGSGTAAVTVNSAPDASLLIENPGTGTTTTNDEYCQGFGPRNLLFNINPSVGAGNTFTLDYSIDGMAQSPITTANRPQDRVSVNPGPGTYTYVLTRITDQTTAQCYKTLNSTTTIKVNPTPNIQANLLDPVICFGDSARVEITVTSGNGTITTTLSGGGADNNSYSFPATTSASAKVFYVTPNTNGTATYTFNTVSDGSTPTCFGNLPAGFSVTVNPAPTAAFTTQYIEICQGDSLVLPYSLSGNSTIKADFNNGANPPVTGSVSNVAGTNYYMVFKNLAPGSYKYKFTTVKDQSTAGCTGTGTDSSSVVVRPTPSLSAAFTTPSPVCFGKTDSLELSGFSGNGPFTIFFRDDLGNTYSTTSASPRVNIPTNQNRTFTVYDIRDNSNPTNGKTFCSANPNIIRSLVVHALPTGRITGNKQVCEDESDSVKFELHGTPPFTVEFIDQDGAGYNPPSSPDSNFNYFIGGKLKYDMKFYNLVIHDGNSPQCSNSGTDTAYIKVHPKPTTTLSSTDPDGCSPLTVTFYNNPANNYTVKSVVWQFADGTTLNDPDSITRTFINRTTHPITVTITSTDDCVNDFQTQAVVYPDPVSEFSWEPQPVTMSESKVRFINQSTIGDSHWTFADFDSSDVHSPNIQFPSEDQGTYQVCLVTTSPFPQQCKDTICYPLTVKGEVLVNVPNTFTPNEDGYNEYWQAVVLGFRPEFFSLAVFDRWGQEIFRTNDPDFKWNAKNKQNQDCPAGVYAYRLEIRSKYSGEKFIKTGSVNIVR